MADEINDPGSVNPEQPTGIPPAEGTPPKDSGNVGGQVNDASGTPGEQTPDENVFFDASNLSDDLKPAYKEMQSSYTKKMQGLSEQQGSFSEKVQAYDAFMNEASTNPMGAIESLAKQYGLQVVDPRNGGNGGVAPAGNENTDWQPGSWAEVKDTLMKELTNAILPQLQTGMKPVFDTIQDITKKSVNAELDEIDPMWRNYESDMMANLKEYPNLVKDAGKLYRMSVPDNVLNSRAVQTAMAKMKDNTEASRMAGTQTTHKSSPAPKKATTFDESVALAREQCIADGSYKP